MGLIQPLSTTATVTCLQSSAFDSKATWDSADKSFHVAIIDRLDANIVRTVVFEFLQPRVKPNVQLATITVDVHVEAGRKDSMISSSHYSAKGRIFIDVGNLPPSFNLVASRLMVLENGIVATNVATSMSAFEVRMCRGSGLCCAVLNLLLSCAMLAAKCLVNMTCTLCAG